MRRQPDAVRLLAAQPILRRPYRFRLPRGNIAKIERNSRVIPRPSRRRFSPKGHSTGSPEGQTRAPVAGDALPRNRCSQAAALRRPCVQGKRQLRDDVQCVRIGARAAKIGGRSSAFHFPLSDVICEATGTMMPSWRSRVRPATAGGMIRSGSSRKPRLRRKPLECAGAQQQYDVATVCVECVESSLQGAVDSKTGASSPVVHAPSRSRDLRSLIRGLEFVRPETKGPCTGRAADCACRGAPELASGRPPPPLPIRD
jgi:hypothetical protein